MPSKYYYFNGNTSEIINAILSILWGKEYYEEISLYSTFINEAQTKRYRKKIKAVLDRMQKENLILIKESANSGDFKIADTIQLQVNSTLDSFSGNARVHLRQYGKEVLSKGGYKMASPQNEQNLVVSFSSIPNTFKFIFIFIIIIALWYFI